MYILTGKAKSTMASIYHGLIRYHSTTAKILFEKGLLGNLQ